MRLRSWQEWCQQPNPTPHQSVVSGPPTTVHNPGELYLKDPENKPDGDQVTDALFEWFTKLDAALDKAVAEGFAWFDCAPRDHGRRIVLLFRRPGTKERFQRSLALDERFSHRGNLPSESDIVDMRIAIQSIVFNEGRVRPDPRIGVIFTSGGMVDVSQDQ